MIIWKDKDIGFSQDVFQTDEVYDWELRRNLQPIRGESKQDMRRTLPIVLGPVWMVSWSCTGMVWRV